MPLHCVQQEGSVRAQGLNQALQRNNRSKQMLLAAQPFKTRAFGLWRILQASGIVADAGQDHVTVVPKIRWGLVLGSRQ